MARYVVDPQTLLRVVADDRRVAHGHQLVAPNSVRSDALGLLLTAVREGDLSEKEALATHTHLTELKMRLLGDRVSRGTAWQLARRGQRVLGLERFDIPSEIGVHECYQGGQVVPYAHP